MGNGGYVCGTLANYTKEDVIVSLRAPAPLDIALDVVTDGGTTQLMQGETVVATAEPAPDAISPEVPAIPRLSAAKTASKSFFIDPEEMYRQCFVCGKDRGDDALHIHAGPVTGHDKLVAAPWTADRDYGGDDGFIRSEIIWAALDCPGYFACSTGERSLLARMQMKQFEQAEAGVQYRVIGWDMGDGSKLGRKRTAGTAIIAPDDSVVASARQIWIVLKS